MTAEALAAYAGVSGSILALLGIVADHLWARRVNERRDIRQEYIGNTKPIGDLLLEIVEFKSDVAEWAHGDEHHTARDITRKGARLNGRINHLLNECYKLEHGGGHDWIKLSTIDYEKAVEFISDDRRALAGNRLKVEAGNLRTAISKMVTDKTPKT